MRIVRFAVGKEARYGVVEEQQVREVEGDIFGKFRVRRKAHPLKRIRFLTPAVPSKVVAVGLNYRDHAEETRQEIPDEPVIFLKPPTSILPHHGKILYPKSSSRVDYEAELGVVIKRETSKVPPEKSLRHVLGFTCFNDVTARDLQKKDGQWTRGKSFNTFAPFGPWIETELDPADAAIRCFLNGEVRQGSNINNLIFDVPFLVSFISHVMTLYPGDVIATGTPSGVGPMQPGDVVEVEVEGIGRLQNTLVRET